MKRSDKYNWDEIEREDKTSSFKRLPDYEYEGVIYPDEAPDWEFETYVNCWTCGDHIDWRMGNLKVVPLIKGALFIDNKMKQRIK